MNGQLPHAARAGLLFALAGFGLLSMGDATLKSLHGAWPGTAIAALRYFFGALLLGTLLWAREGKAGFVCPSPWLQCARGASIAMGSTLFFLSLFLMPLAEVTVIQFISPLLVALLSGLFLKEYAPRAAWIATFIAFIGVLFVLRPSVASLGWTVVLPLAAALGMSLMMMFNRMVAGQASALQMQFLISVFAVPFLLAATVAGHWSGLPSLHVPWPSTRTVFTCLGVACSASLAHAMIYLATERATAASVAPAVYIQLLIALVVGYFIFDESPDGIAMAGAALIVGAGLYLWHKSGTQQPPAASSSNHGGSDTP